MSTSAITVDYWRFRNDDGSESSATWKAAQNVAASIVASSVNPTVFRLRLAIDNEPQNGPSAVWSLKVSHNGGGFNAVTSSSSFVQGAVSALLTDGGSTTQQLSGVSSYVSEPGVVNNVSALSASFGLNNGVCTELEWALMIPAGSVSASDTLDFNIACSSSNYTLVQYSGNVRLTVSAVTSGSGTSRGWPNDMFTPLPKAGMIRSL